MNKQKPAYGISALAAAVLSLTLYGCDAEAGKRGRETTTKPDSLSVKLYEYVDPFIGTDAHGHTFPGASAPFGLVQLSPDTRWEGWDACSGYHYSDSRIYGFSHTHLSGTGASDLCDVLFIPATDTKAYTDSIRNKHLPAVPFSHDDEEAHAGYYSVKLANGIKAELTASTFAGIHRYTFPESGSGHLIIDLVSFKEEKMLGAGLEKTGNSVIQGFQKTTGWTENEEIYFYAKFSRPIEGMTTYLDGKVMKEDKAEGDSVRAVLTFAGSDLPLEIYVGLSTTSVSEAKANLEHDLEGRDFDEMRVATEASWEKVLGKVRIPDGDPRDLTTFYTALYHSYLAPNLISDASGSYRGLDGQVHAVPSGEAQYSTFSLWDTYRALHPWFTLFEKKETANFVRSMLNMYDEQGELPIWPLVSGETRTMIGYHATSVIADAYLRGIGGFSADRALTAMVKSSDINRKGGELYAGLGYVPFDRKNESVSQTLEYAYDDWCIYMMAEKMGNSEVSEQYKARALNYQNLFDGSSCFFRPKSSTGVWEKDFNSYDVSRHYTEANAFQYRFAVQHDVNGMMQLYGGREAFLEKLYDLYADQTVLDTDLPDLTGFIGQYIHGNEPSHHLAYLFTYAGDAWKTQELTRHILREMYTSEPDGVPGNEDCGQMSAWYIFSALGFYPVTPGSGEYVLTTPLFEETSLTLSGGNTLKITANDPKNNLYIKSVSLNGKPLSRLFITYDEIMAGGELAFELTKEPVKDYPVKELPYSLTRGEKASPVYTEADLHLFEKEVSFELKTATPNAQIRYTIDGSIPTEESPLYVRPITLKEGATIQAIALGQGKPSDPTVFRATKATYMPPMPEKNGMKQGLNYTLYSGIFDSIAAIERGKRQETGSTLEVSEAIGSLADNYGLIFRGFVRIDADGVYEFALTSDDGSALFVDGKSLIDNDGSHSAIKASGLVALQKGLHRIEVRYFQGTEGRKLSLGIRKRGETDFTLPQFYH